MKEYEIGWTCGTYDGLEDSLDRVLARKPEGKRPHGRLRYSWEDNIKMCLEEIQWERGLD